jgi:hypothetical protein
VLTRREKHQAALTAQEGPIDIAKAVNQRIDTLAVESRRFQLGNTLFFQPVTLTLFRGTERVIVQIRCAKFGLTGTSEDFRQSLPGGQLRCVCRSRARPPREQIERTDLAQV